MSAPAESMNLHAMPKEELQALYDEHGTCRLSRIAGVSRDFVSRLIKDRGLKRRKKGQGVRGHTLTVERKYCAIEQRDCVLHDDREACLVCRNRKHEHYARVRSACTEAVVRT